MILSIDPGLRGCGIAIWSKIGELIEAQYLANPARGDGPAAWRLMAFAVKVHLGNWSPAEVVLEIPQVYRRSKGDPNDLIQLAGVDGAIVGILAAKHVGYLPREWKGQISKTVAHPRYLSKLSESERKKIHPCPKSLIHNVYDAIGLGMYHLRITGRRRDVKNA